MKDLIKQVRLFLNENKPLLHIFVHKRAELSYISADCTCIIPLYIYPWGGKVEILKVSCVNSNCNGRLMNN